MRLKEKLRKKNRMRELMEWAQRDYGINMAATKDAKRKYKHEIQDEVDFIFKVKQKYIKKRNYDAASKLQALFRARL